MPDRDAVLRQVRALLAEALRYPEEIFTDDLDLELDLGVDSLIRVELLRRYAERYGLVADTGVADCTTVGAVADLILATGAAAR